MKTIKTRQLPFIPESVVFEAVLDMADRLGIPVKTENYDLLAAVTAGRIHIRSATYSRRYAQADLGRLEPMGGIISQRLQLFLRRLYSLVSGHEATEEKSPPGHSDEKLKSGFFNRSLKDVPNGELSRAVEKLAAALKIPVRSEDYDLMIAIFDEKVRDRKAS